MNRQSLIISSSFFLRFFLVVNGDVVTDVCNKLAQNPNVGFDFCVRSLEAYPKSHSATLEELGSISIKLVNGKATNVQIYIQRLIQGSRDPRDRKALNNCIFVYGNAIRYIQDANTAFVSKNFGSANQSLREAFHVGSDCKDGLTGGLASELAQPVKDYLGLVEIGLAITDMLWL